MANVVSGKDLATVAGALRQGEQQVFFRAGGEWCYLWTPASFRPGAPVPVLIHHHGSTGYVRDGEADWLIEDYKPGYLRSIMEATGCAVAGSHACGEHWGNPQAVAANAALYQALADSQIFDLTRVGLMGGGLGGLLLWNSVLGPLAGKARVAVLMQACASATAMICEQKFKGPLLEAYGLPQDMADAPAIARVLDNDPLPRLQQLTRGTPLPRTVIFHGGHDENVPAASNAVPLAGALLRAGVDVSLQVFGEVEHSVYEMGEPIRQRLVAFFAEAL